MECYPLPSFAKCGKLPIYALKETVLKDTTEIAILPKLGFVPPSVHVIAQSQVEIIIC